MQDPDNLQQILETLEISIGEDYPHQDLVRQREALLEFLGAVGKRISTLRNSYGSSYERRRELIGPVDEWRARHAPLFPKPIQSAIAVICKSASACLQDHFLEQINSVGASELIAFHWTVLQRYEELLQKRLAKSERERIGQVEHRDGLAATASSVVAGDEETPDFRHSKDYRSVYLKGRQFELSLNQARIVEELHKGHLAKTPVISDAHLLEQLNLKADRLRDVFKGSDAWGILIVQGKRRGTRRLNL